MLVILFTIFFSASVIFQCPRRPNHGVEGRSIVLRANHFAVRIPGGTIQHYAVEVQPDKCPRRVNRYSPFFYQCSFIYR